MEAGGSGRASLPGGLDPEHRNQAEVGGVRAGVERRAAQRTLASSLPRRHQLPATLLLAKHRGKPGAAGRGGTSASVHRAGSASQSLSPWERVAEVSWRPVQTALGPHSRSASRRSAAPSSARQIPDAAAPGRAGLGQRPCVRKDGPAGPPGLESACHA